MEGEMDGQKWHRRYSKDSYDGEKIYYTCEGYRNCPKLLYLLLHADCQDVTVFICDSHEHNHEHRTRTHRLLKEVKFRLIHLLEFGVTRNEDLNNALKEDGFSELKASQLNNFKKRYSSVFEETLSDFDPFDDEQSKRLSEECFNNMNFSNASSTSQTQEATNAVTPKQSIGITSSSDKTSIQISQIKNADGNGFSIRRSKRLRDQALIDENPTKKVKPNDHNKADKLCPVCDLKMSKKLYWYCPNCKKNKK